jgi:ATP-dependent Clp protease ATP-binding subunit ClpA
MQAFVAPHHVLLALVHAPDVESIILGAGLTYESLEKAILDIRGPIRVYRTKEGTCATSLDSLKSYCFDISALAENGDAVQAIDREDDCRRMIRVLSTRFEASSSYY